LCVCVCVHGCARILPVLNSVFACASMCVGVSYVCLCVYVFVHMRVCVCVCACT